MNLLAAGNVYIYEDRSSNLKGGAPVEAFERQLEEVYPQLERYVKYRLDGSSDAEDLLQDICLTGYLKYGQLERETAFKPWLLAIARNKCSDYFRRKGLSREVPLEQTPSADLVYGRQGWTISNPVEDTLERLSRRDEEILRLFYWKQLSQAEIARQLRIPVGTVKSRLNTARERFRRQYPYPPKGAIEMQTLPRTIPSYTIEARQEEPFSVRWEELQGWMIVPRLGQMCRWGLYESPSGKGTEYTEMKVVGKAQVHGLEGVEITACQYGAQDERGADKTERRFVAQLTDTHCRYLAESHMENGVRKCLTFLDGPEFLDSWGFGPDNCGNEINLAPRGLLRREGDIVTGSPERDALDVVGRYAVTINGKTYDTVCVMDVRCQGDAVALEQYIDAAGRTVLWRRFNRDDWAIGRFGGRPWSEQLPDNQRLHINGRCFVHWYDCISDHIL